MTRRLSRPGVVAALAAATLGALGALGALSAPAQAQPPTPTHVAVVVDGVGTACVPWHSGMTGADVLTARFDVQWGQPTPSGNYAGMVVQINGVPTDPNPHTAYWAYFRNSGSGWQYSGSGALSTHPQPGTVEGWRLDSAATSAHAAPPAGSYASICAGQDSTRAPTPSTRASTPARHTRAPKAASTRSANAATDPAKATPARTATRETHRAPTTRPSTRGTAATTPDRTVASDAPATRAVTLSSTPAALTHHGGDGIPPWGTALAIVVVVALGGAAVWRARR
jgi:hypothetical protein